MYTDDSAFCFATGLWWAEQGTAGLPVHLKSPDDKMGDEEGEKAAFQHA